MLFCYNKCKRKMLISRFYWVFGLHLGAKNMYKPSDSTYQQIGFPNPIRNRCRLE